MTLFVGITDAEGDYEFKIEYVHVSTDRKLYEESFPIHVDDRLGTMYVSIKMAAGIDQPGEYEIRVFTDGAYLGRARFTAVPVS